MIYDALEEKRDEVAAKARDNIADICERFGARDAGSEGEKQTAEYFEGRLKAVCDDVKTEKFSVAPDAYFAWASIVASLALLSFVTYFFSGDFFGIGVYTAGGYRSGGIRYSVHCKQALFRSSLQGQDLSKRDRGEKSERRDTQPTIFCCSYRRYKRVDTSL